MTQILAFSKWCCHLSLAEMAQHLKRTGVDGVDLPVRANAAAFSRDQAPRMLPEAKKVFEDHGLLLTQCVTDITSADGVEPAFAAFAACGVRQIRLGAWVIGKTDDPAAKLWRRVGLQYRLHQCMGTNIGKTDDDHQQHRNVKPRRDAEDGDADAVERDAAKHDFTSWHTIAEPGNHHRAAERAYAHGREQKTLTRCTDAKNISGKDR